MRDHTARNTARPRKSVLDQLQPGGGADAYSVIRQNSHRPAIEQFPKSRLIAAIQSQLSYGRFVEGRQV